MTRPLHSSTALLAGALLWLACDAQDRGAAREEPPLDSALVTRIEAAIVGRLARDRYMEQECTLGAYPGWDGFPLEECRYSQTDSDGRVKRAVVIMLNAPPGRLARWVAHACRSAKRLGESMCADTLLAHVSTVSGAQFPVAGVVLEDLLPGDAPDGVHEMYCFRDGVTVVVNGFKNGAAHAPTEQEVAACLHGTVARVRSYARIQSTTPQQYRDNGGTVDVGSTDSPTEAWRRVIRESYQAAWGFDRNELMIAWVRANL